MKLSMNQATCLEKSSLEKDLELCEKYGYDMIEPRTMDGIPNYLKNHTIDELAAWFKSHKVKPLAFNTLCFFNNRTPEDYQKVLQELRQMCEWGKKIGCKTIITVPTVDLKKVTRQEIHKSAVKCLKEMGEIAAEYGMRISVEFIGHPAASINTFGEAWSVIEDVDMDNVGITRRSSSFTSTIRRTSRSARCSMRTASGLAMAASTSTLSSRRSRRSAGRKMSSRSSSSVRNTTRWTRKMSIASARRSPKRSSSAISELCR